MGKEDEIWGKRKVVGLGEMVQRLEKGKMKMSGAVGLLVNKLAWWEESTVPPTMLLRIDSVEDFQAQVNRPNELLFWVIDNEKDVPVMLVDRELRVVQSKVLTDPVQRRSTAELDFEHQEVWAMHAGGLKELGFYIDRGMRLMPTGDLYKV